MRGILIVVLCSAVGCSLPGTGAVEMRMRACAGADLVGSIDLSRGLACEVTLSESWHGSLGIAAIARAADGSRWYAIRPAARFSEEEAGELVPALDVTFNSAFRDHGYASVGAQYVEDDPGSTWRAILGIGWRY